MSRPFFSNAAAWLLAVPATAFAAHQERRILKRGRPLTDREATDAHRVGVSEPGRVRILAQPSIANPLAGIAKRLGRPRAWLAGEIEGMALGHGILVAGGTARTRDTVLPPNTDRGLVAHELAHVAQYERAGSRFRFIRTYIAQCLESGYARAPLEQEANAAAAACTRDRPLPHGNPSL